MARYTANQLDRIANDAANGKMPSAAVIVNIINDYNTLWVSRQELVDELAELKTELYRVRAILPPQDE